MDHYFRLLVFITSLISGVAVADASVWRVSKGDHQLFIGGTIHVLQEQDYPLPPEFERAYAQAEKLVFEVDLAQADSPAFQQELMQAALYEDGSTLISHVRPSTFRQLEVFMQRRGMALEHFISFKVGMLVLILTINELNRHGIEGEGVDQYFSARAAQDSKPVIALESIEQQIQFLANMGKGEEDELVLQTVEELENLGAEFSALKSAWQRGDTQALVTLGLEDFKKFPAAYQSMLVNRNRAWLPKIEALLEDQVVEYVLVGVLHLVGEDSVLAMLEARGYQVERY